MLTSILPVYCFAANIAGDRAAVENLLPPGVSAHDFQFSPRDLAKLKSADLVIINGLGLETWLQKLLQHAAGTKTVVEAFGNLPETLQIPDASAGPATHAHHEAGHRHGPVNPHAWLDPTLASCAVSNILLAFQKADPPNAAAYAQNARAYVERLQQIDTEIRNALGSAPTLPVVTQHDAFPYFARRYQLRIVGIIQPVADVQPSPRHLAALQQRMRAERVRAIFSHPQDSDKLARRISQDLNIPLAVLDPLENGPLDLRAYEDGMRSNLAVLKRLL